MPNRKTSSAFLCLGIYFKDAGMQLWTLSSKLYPVYLIVIELLEMIEMLEMILLLW